MSANCFEKGEGQGHGDELDGLLEHRGHKQPQPVAAPAGGVGQNPQPQRDRRQAEQDVDQGQAQDHLHQQVEDEEAEDQVEQGDEHGQPVLAACTAVSSGSRGARSRSPGVTSRDAAMNWETAWATSMTRAHHHREDAAAVRPSTSRGTISRQPD